MLRKLLLLGGLLIAASPSFAQFRHVSLQDNSRPLPQKVIILPADVVVQELSAGGLLEKVPEWTRQSSENLTRAVTELAKNNKKFSVVDTPALSEQEQDALEQAFGTFMVVGTTANSMLLGGGSAWEHKRKEFDYTLGPSLAFLKAKTGADAAILVAADDIVSSGGRKAAVVFAAMLGLGLHTGRSVALTSMVDLSTGNLLWLHFDSSASKDLKDYSSAKEMMEQILATYPDGK